MEEPETSLEPGSELHKPQLKEPLNGLKEKKCGHDHEEQNWNGVWEMSRMHIVEL